MKHIAMITLAAAAVVVTAHAQQPAPPAPVPAAPAAPTAPAAAPAAPMDHGQMMAGCSMMQGQSCPMMSGGQCSMMGQGASCPMMGQGGCAMMHQGGSCPMMHQGGCGATPDTTLNMIPWAWYFTTGGLHADWGDVATNFNSAGYNDPPQTIVQLGGGAYGIVGRWLLGAEGWAYLSDATASGARTTKVGGGAGYFTVGYVAVKTEKVRAYPVLGLGGTGVTLRIEDLGGVGIGPNVVNPSFGQVLASPGQRSKLDAAGFAMTVGAGMDLVPMMIRQRDGSYYGLMIGVRAGYQFVPVHGDWELYDLRVSGGPNDLLNGFFVRLTIGGAGRTPNRHH